MSMVDSFEKIPVKIFGSLEEGSRFIGKEIAHLIRRKRGQRRKDRTGSGDRFLAQIPVCGAGQAAPEEQLSFKNVITFNLDEYYPIDNDALQSYNRFMKEQLFDKVDIDPANCHIPNGQWEKEKIKQHCIEYEEMIERPAVSTCRSWASAITGISASMSRVPAFIPVPAWCRWTILRASPTLMISRTFHRCPGWRSPWASAPS
jgi:hypothetical protein